MTAKKTATVDPLAGIPVATPRPARPAQATANAPISIAQGRANVKRRKLTGDAYKQARDFARKTTGYNDTSPIWGKKMPEVLTSIELDLKIAEDLLQINPVNIGDVLAHVQGALEFNRELQKRVATGQLIGAQS